MILNAQSGILSISLPQKTFFIFCEIQRLKLGIIFFFCPQAGRPRHRNAAVSGIIFSFAKAKEKYEKKLGSELALWFIPVMAISYRNNPTIFPKSSSFSL